MKINLLPRYQAKSRAGEGLEAQGSGETHCKCVKSEVGLVPLNHIVMPLNRGMRSGFWVYASSTSRLSNW